MLSIKVEKKESSSAVERVNTPSVARRNTVGLQVETSPNYKLVRVFFIDICIIL